jgi:saccharopine dehydrogenase-like NADP-dependent oxidoreductase
VVIRDLAESKDVSEVVIADINEREAKRFADELRSKPETKAKLSTIQLDVYDHHKLVETVKGSDAAIDTTHQDCGAVVAKGIIDAKVNGCSLGSIYTVAQKILLLDKLAKDMGITYLVSAGVFPGATNLLAKYLADKMERVEDIHLSMVIFRPITLSPSLVDIFLSYITSTGVTYENGVLKETSPFSGREEVEYPEPFGKQVIYNIPSSEPLTLPIAMKGKAIRNVHVKATYYPDYMEMMKICYDLGLTNTTPVKVKDRDMVPADVFRELLIRRPIEPGREVVKFAQRVKVTGKNKGAKVERVIFTPFLSFEGEREDPETRATGEPGSIIVQMLARGSIKEKGVMGPESCIEPKAFVEEWANRRGVEIYESCTESRRI